MFQFFLDVKRRRDLEIIDSHIHPFDVFGVCSVGNGGGPKASVELQPSLLERLGYNNVALRVLRYVFYFFPTIIKKSIIGSFQNTNKEELLLEMKNAGVDKGVLIPLEPHVGVKNIFEEYKSEEFLRLGSIDIHRIPYEDIDSVIDNQVNDFKIIGIKLHPNLQAFFPQPSMNSQEIARKLEKIYAIAENRKLYVLFHGGISYLLNQKEKVAQYAKLENFCDMDGRSEVFKYNIPIVIAHVGHYNIASPNLPLLSVIAKNYKNVFFDTSGVSPDLIAKSLNVIGVGRLIFGSDANYFRIKFNVQLVLGALKKAKTIESFEEKIVKVFSQNYKDIISTTI